VSTDSPFDVKFVWRKGFRQKNGKLVEVEEASIQRKDWDGLMESNRKWFEEAKKAWAEVERLKKLTQEAS
jgi:hypothetical protein